MLLYQKGGYFLWKKIKKLIVQLQAVNTMMKDVKNVNWSKLLLLQLLDAIQNNQMNLCVVAIDMRINKKVVYCRRIVYNRYRVFVWL